MKVHSAVVTHLQDLNIVLRRGDLRKKHGRKLHNTVYVKLDPQINGCRQRFLTKFLQVRLVEVQEIVEKRLKALEAEAIELEVRYGLWDRLPKTCSVSRGFFGLLVGVGRSIVVGAQLARAKHSVLSWCVCVFVALFCMIKQY